MKKKRYREEQIIGAIKQHESGVKAEKNWTKQRWIIEQIQDSQSQPAKFPTPELTGSAEPQASTFATGQTDRLVIF